MCSVLKVASSHIEEKKIMIRNQNFDLYFVIKQGSLGA